jgi:hypothetical protein
MPILSHLTSANDAASIRRTGIKAVSLGRGTPRGVFCMPRLPDYFASHQWLRELKRRGQRTIVAVDFRLPSDEPVWVGRFHEQHRGIDARGFEVVVPRSIRRDEILRVRTPSQVLGWRYSPDAHGRRPTCACRVCLPKGTIKSRRLRQRLDPTGESY